MAEKKAVIVQDLRKPTTAFELARQNEAKRDYPADVAPVAYPRQPATSPWNQWDSGKEPPPNGTILLRNHEARAALETTDEPRFRICVYGGCTKPCGQCDAHFDGAKFREAAEFILGYRSADWRDGSLRLRGPEKLAQAWETMARYRAKWGPEGRDERADDVLLGLWGDVARIMVKDAPWSQFAKDALAEIGERWGSWEEFIAAMKECREKVIAEEKATQ
jgi:hypothetical protein